MYIRYRQLEEQHDVQRLNRVSFVLGVISAFGISVVANFQVGKEKLTAPGPIIEQAQHQVLSLSRCSIRSHHWAGAAPGLIIEQVQHQVSSLSRCCTRSLL